MLKKKKKRKTTTDIANTFNVHFRKPISGCKIRGIGKMN